jgi:hypothetical protein
MKFLRLVIYVLFIFSSSAYSQSVKFNYFGYNSWQKFPGKRNFYLGAGYEHNLNSRISLSLDYNSGYNLEDEAWSPVQYSDGVYGYSFSYMISGKWQEVAYTSKYFLTDNEESSIYISSGIGYRIITMNLDIQSDYFDLPYASLGEQIGRGALNKRMTMFPITMRLGNRGSIDDWFGDYYIGLTFIPGGSGKGSGNDAFDHTINQKLFNTFSVTIGLSVGIGWAE